jgi:hypothetical protein
MTPLQFAAVALGLLPSTLFAATCDDPKGKPETLGHLVTLARPPNSPFYYYRLDDEYVVLIDHAAIVAKLSAPDAATPNRPKAVLRANLLSSAPLRENKDLYAYILADPGQWFPIRSLVIDLIESGKASVIDAGANPLKDLYVEHDRQVKGIATSVRLHKPKQALQLIWRLDCIVG